MPYEPNMYDSHMHTQLCNTRARQPGRLRRRSRAKGTPRHHIHLPQSDALRLGIPRHACRSISSRNISRWWRRRPRNSPGVLICGWAWKAITCRAWKAGWTICTAVPDFSYILGSVHPQTDEYRLMYLEGSTRLEYEKSYFENLANAAESGLFDCLSHPDIVKIVHPKQYKVSDHLDTIRRALDRIARAGTAMELNTSGLHKPYPEMNPGAEILARWRKGKFRW